MCGPLAESTPVDQGRQPRDMGCGVDESEILVSRGIQLTDAAILAAVR
jgi:hypothetical protein